MVSKVGKYGVLLLLFSFFCAMADIRLKLTDMSGASLKQAAVGVPFILEVIAPSSSKSIQSPTIQGLESLQPRQISFQLRGAGGGKSEVVYRYRLQASQPGNYTVGPIIAKTGEPIDNTIVSFLVADEPIVQQKGKKKVVKEPFFRLTSPYEKPIVGESISFTGRFYFPDESITLKAVSEPECQGLVNLTVEGPFQGTEEVDETTYQYLEWRWQGMLMQAGRVVLPACTADYEVAKEQQFQLGGFGRFFGTQVESRRTYSNALVFTVDPLPAYHKEVAFIGTLDHLKTTLSSAMVKEGEGLIFTLQFTGKGVEHIKTPALFGLESGLKYYESKTSVQTQSNGRKTKQFEYIVQGIEPGSWRIPSQSFVYFDTTTRSYKEVHTDESSLGVIAQVGSSATQPTEQTMLSSPETVTKPMLFASASSYRLVQMPWWLVGFLLLLPLIYLFMAFLKNRFYATYYNQAMARYAFVLARSKLQKKYPLSAKQIHTTLNESFANRYAQSVQEITADFIDAKLREAGFSEKQCAEWTRFTTLLAEHEYGSHYGGVALPELIAAANRWLEQFEGQL